MRKSCFDFLSTMHKTAWHSKVFGEWKLENKGISFVFVSFRSRSDLDAKITLTEPEVLQLEGCEININKDIEAAIRKSDIETCCFVVMHVFDKSGVDQYSFVLRPSASDAISEHGRRRGFFYKCTTCDVASNLLMCLTCELFVCPTHTDSHGCTPGALELMEKAFVEYEKNSAEETKVVYEFVMNGGDPKAGMKPKQAEVDAIRANIEFAKEMIDGGEWPVKLSQAGKPKLASKFSGKSTSTSIKSGRKTHTGRRPQKRPRVLNSQIAPLL
jgi:hypothetical protein